MDIGKDLQRAYDDGYEQGKRDAVKHGKWIHLTQNAEPTALKCSLCGEISCCRGMYCPDCGARMDGET